MEKESKSKNSPPRWLDSILKLFCSPDFIEEVIGDLHERYQLRIQRSGKVQANFIYFRDIFSYLRFPFLQRKVSFKPTVTNMITRHFTTSMRNILRGRTFSLINIGGLALGITCFLSIFLWIDAERSVDDFHQNGDQLYVVYYSEFATGNTFGGYKIPQQFTDPNFDGTHILANELKEAFPEVKYATTYATSYELPWGHACTFRIGDKQQKFEGSTAGPDFFNMFSFPLLFGEPETALATRSGIVISRRMAESFFESPAKAMGQTIRYENFRDFVITAVFEDINGPSTLTFDYLVNWDLTHDDGILVSGGSWSTFIQLEANANAHLLDDKIKDFLQARIGDQHENTVELGLQPFRDQYLVSNFVEGKPTDGRIEYVQIFTWVALFVLLVACINFMNLATARSVKRAKEVGIRKVIGSSRSTLILQFLMESILMSFMAVALALVLIIAGLPILNELTGKSLELPLQAWLFWMELLFLGLNIGLVSGSYPALFLSALKPGSVLKGHTRFKGKAAWLQKGLVVFQFSLSILILISTVVVSRQTNFIQHKHLGYDRENLISVRIEGALNQEQKYLLLKSKLEQMPGIALVDRSSEAPHNMGFEMASPFQWQGKVAGEGVSFLPTSVGYDFIELMNLKIKEGRNFDRNIASDTAAFMINETALKQMGISNPIGKWISAWAKRGHIIAVLEDYHTHSLHDPIKPLIVDVKEFLNFGLILIKTKPGQTQEALASMEKSFREVNPNYPLNYKIVDDEYTALYHSELVISRLSNAFAALAIVISCLGLLGLAMFAAEQRMKEVGIRKVLGASITSILNLFSKSFLQLIGIAFLLATPISWYLMNSWLKGFAYRVDLAWWIFLGTGIITGLVALLTISIQAIKTAISNPVNALRSE